MKKSHKREQGAIAIVIALCSVVLLGMIGIALDIGFVYLQKARAQQVADAEALACVINPSSSPCPASGTGLYPEVNSYNFTVQTTNPGDSSLCPLPSIQSKCAVANVTATWNTYFLPYFGIKTLSVGASATAGLTTSSPCMLAMGSSGIGIQLTGSGAVSATNCGITVNQTGTSIRLIGSGSITATPINVMGSVSKVGSGNISPTSHISTAASDPFAGVPPPSYSNPPPSTCTSTTLISYSGSLPHILPAGNYCGGVSNTGSGSLTLGPGYYNGISSNGSGTVTFTSGNYVIYGSGLNLTGSGNVSVGSGTYVIDGGGLGLTGSGNVSGTAVTFYNTGDASNPAGPLNVTGSGGFNLSAPTSGADQGMLFVQPASNSNPASIVGSGTSTFAGNIDIPSADLTLTGSGGANIPFGIIVANTITVTGSGAINVTNQYNPNPTTSSGKPVLVN